MLSLIFYTRALFALLVMAAAVGTLALSNPAIAEMVTIMEVVQA